MKPFKFPTRFLKSFEADRVGELTAANTTSVSFMTVSEARVFIAMVAHEMAVEWGQLEVPWIPNSVAERTQTLAIEILGYIDQDDHDWWETRIKAGVNVQRSRSEALLLLTQMLQDATRKRRNELGGSPSRPTPPAEFPAERLDELRNQPVIEWADWPGESTHTSPPPASPGSCPNCGATGQAHRICSRCRRVRER